MLAGEGERWWPPFNYISTSYALLQFNPHWIHFLLGIIFVLSLGHHAPPPFPRRIGTTIPSSSRRHLTCGGFWIPFTSCQIVTHKMLERKLLDGLTSYKLPAHSFKYIYVFSWGSQSPVSLTIYIYMAQSIQVFMPVVRKAQSMWIGVRLCWGSTHGRTLPTHVLIMHVAWVSVVVVVFGVFNFGFCRLFCTYAGNRGLNAMNYIFVMLNYEIYNQMFARATEFNLICLAIIAVIVICVIHERLLIIIHSKLKQTWRSLNDEIRHNNVFFAHKLEEVW